MDKIWENWYSHMVNGNIKLGMIVLKCPGNPQMAKKYLQGSVIRLQQIQHKKTVRAHISTCT